MKRRARVAAPSRSTWRPLISVATFATLNACHSVEDRAPVSTGPLNVLLITADDLQRESVGAFARSLGAEHRYAPGDLTPNLDLLAAQGMRFDHAHVNIAVCQPVRSLMMTGLWPHQNGAIGFGPVNDEVPTLPELLRKQGWQTGILGKVTHLSPPAKFPWHHVVQTELLRTGRDPERYGEHARAFLRSARSTGRPFFLMVNAHDPHRPFPGSDQESRKTERAKYPGSMPPPPPVGDSTDVPVPGFLPDLAAVRQEVAEYHAGVRRMDRVIGSVLRTLDEEGFADSTLVIFLSDHGMAFPFAKTNCLNASTRTPLIVRWPGRVEGPRVDRDHVVSTIDLMPTFLEAANLPRPEQLEGRSLLALLSGEGEAGREYALTTFHQTSARRDYPMRGIQGRRFSYVYNAWSDGETVFKNESQSGRTFKAMQVAAEHDPAIAERVRLLQYRVVEELYDHARDPDSLHNLVDDPDFADELRRMRVRLRDALVRTEDPLSADFRRYLASVSVGVAVP